MQHNEDGSFLLLFMYMGDIHINICENIHNFAISWHIATQHVMIQNIISPSTSVIGKTEFTKIFQSIPITNMLHGLLPTSTLSNIVIIHPEIYFTVVYVASVLHLSALIMGNGHFKSLPNV